MADVPRKSKAGVKEPALTVEERELFLNAYFQGEDVPHGKYAKDADPTAPSRVKTVEESEQDLFLRAVNEGIGDATKHRKGIGGQEARHLTQARKRKLVDGEIDLHGMSAEDAVLALHRFIDQQQRRGKKTLLVVHGKGAGILKNAIWAAVEAHPLVSDFQVAGGKLGGQGAIVVKINRRRKKY